MKILFILLFISSLTFAQYEDTGRRGLYFDKKEYSGAEIPSFEAYRDKLPQPVLDDNKELVELYWKAWELAFKHMKKPPKGSPFISNYFDAASAPNVFQWDTIFMIMFSRYGEDIFPSVQSLDNFYSRQHENGYICREIQESDGQDYVYKGRDNTVNPPLYGWAEIGIYKLTGDKSRFTRVIPVLEKLAGWLEKYRRKENTKHNLYWQTGLGSGMDNTPQSGSGWVCLSTQMEMLYDNLSFMCKETGREKEAELYASKAKDIGERINKFMWNEEDGLYYNLDDEGNQVKAKTVACFWPMFAGLCDLHKAEKLMANLKDPKSFWRPMPFPTLAADQKGYKPEGSYWLGSVWAPTNVMIVKGLDQFSFDDNNYDSYAFRKFGAYASEKYLEAMYDVYKKTGTIWENYSSEFSMPGFPANLDFVGWTGCGPVMLLIENVLGIHADALKNEITWDLDRIDTNGIKKLKFGGTTTTLISQKRNALNSPAVLTIESDKPYSLRVFKWDKKSKTFEIKKGINNITVE